MLADIMHSKVNKLLNLPVAFESKISARLLKNFDAKTEASFN
jgi:hypothetical protein